MNRVSMRLESLSLFSAACREYRVLCHFNSKESCTTVVQDCLSLAAKFGRRGLVALFNVLVEDIDLREGRLSELQPQRRKLEILKVLLNEAQRSSEFASALSQALLASGKFCENYLNNFVDAVSIHFDLQVKLALSVAQTTDSLWNREGWTFLKEKLLEFDQPDVHISESHLHELITFVDAHPSEFVEYEHFTRKIRERAALVSKNNVLFHPPQTFVSDNPQATTTMNIEDNYTLPGLLEEIGYVATSNNAIFKSILERFRINETSVAEMLGRMIKTREGLDERSGESMTKGVLDLVLGTSLPIADRTTTGWNLDVVVEVLKSHYPDFNWFGVANAFDYEDFFVPDAQAFEMLVSCFRKAVQENFPLETVIGRVWRNTEGQLSFLRYAVQAPPEIFTFEHSRKKMNRLDGIQNGKTPFGTPNHAWLCFDLVKTLCTLGDVPRLTEKVMEVLSYPLKHCQEVLLVVMASVSQDWGKIQKQVADKLMPVFLTSNPNTFVVLLRIWPTCKDRVVEHMIRMYETDPASVSRILDVCQELKALQFVLDKTPHFMACDIATLAARREYLNLDRWLKDKYSADGILFLESLLKFLDSKLDAMAASTGTASSRSLTANILRLYIHVLKNYVVEFSPEMQEMMNQVEGKAGLQFPDLRSLKAPAEQTEVFASDIEDEANVYFHRVYSEQTRLEDVIAMLKQYRTSSDQREQEVFACMVHNLFDEYRFFPEYPEKALHITAMLFGQLIHHQLVSSITLGIALRYVIDALQSEDNPNMFKFGLTAINQFKTELPGWPQYCAQVLRIPRVREADPELAAYIEAALANKSNRKETIPDAPAPETLQGLNPEPPLAETSAVAGPSSSMTLPATSTSVLESASEMFADFEEAPESVKDKVAFIFNNLSAMNIDSKVQILKDVVPEDYEQWLANYIVVKRAAQESNFQLLYMSLLDKMGNKRLLEYIVQFTYQYIKILLENDKIKSEINNRSLLKGLGSWLGQLTLARNKPVRQKDLDLKSIIYEAYEKGKMVAVIPFVHKVLEQCRESKVYGPDNPWIKGILTLLAEIYHLEGLRINISFEIEMIFKDFEINMDDVEPLKSLDTLEREIEGNPDFYEQGRQAHPPPPAIPFQMEDVPYRKGTHQLPLEPPPSMTVPTNASLFAMRQAMDAPPDMSQVSQRPSFQTPSFPSVPTPGTPGIGSGMQPMDSNTLGQMTATLHQLVVINPSLASIAERVPLKKLVAVGIDRAIYEIITPVVERSVMIACTTTKELVTKDFAMEPDEKKLRQAAHLMVSSLAGSLALVTCKEPLKVSLFNNLKQVLSSVLDHTLLEHTVNIVIADNLDLGCTIIEKASTDKAVKEVDERLLPYYQSRQKARAQNTPFYDMSIFNKGNSRFPAALPESLRPRPGHPNPHITRVYDDFARISRTGQQPMHVDPTHSAMEHPQHVSDSMVATFKPTTLGEKYSIWQTRLDAALAKENQALELSSLPETSEMHGLAAELTEIVNMTQKREDIAVMLAERLFILLYDRPSMLSGSIICAGLNAIKNLGFNNLPIQLTSWYGQVCQNEARRFNRVVINSLAKANLLYYPELDVFLMNCLSSRPGPVVGTVDFIVMLINQNMIQDRVMKASDLPHTLEVLRALASKTSEGERIVMLIDEAKKLLRDGDPDGLREQVTPKFDNWAKIVHAEPANIAAGIEQFVKAGFLRGDDVTNRVFRICTELSVLHCVNTETPGPQGTKTGDGRVSFIMIDAFVKLAVTLKDYIENMDGIAGLKRILETIVLVLYRDHDDRASLFNSRPYYRIFIGLFQELLSESISDQDAFETLTTLASALISFRPQRVPGFTFSWMELISHRLFLPRLLRYPNRKGWPYFRALFVGILIFMQPYLRHGELMETLRVLYKGLLRIMLVILHDFPEFYCEYHVELCNIIPPSCVQMRNLVLSASPSHILLPDPFAPNINMELLPDIKVEPKILLDVGKMLPESLKEGIDEYVKTASPPSFLDSIIGQLILSPEAQKIEGTSYNVTYMNCVVLYTGMVALSCKGMPSHAADIFKKLANDLDSEGRYLFLNGIANQLRYPNSHTHFFSNLLLSLFVDAENRVLQEQIARVVSERLIVHKPHPWGLFITCMELVQNPRYKFWESGITASSPEIEHLFDTFAKSFMPSAAETLPSDETNKLS